MNRAITAMIPLAFFVGGIYSANAEAADTATPMNSVGKPVWAGGSAAEAARLRSLSEKRFQTMSSPVGSTSSDSANGGADSNEQTPPQLTSQTLTSRNAHGIATTLLSQGPVPSTATEPFFLSLGGNGRTCQTCHEPDAGWTITPRKIKRLFQTNPAAPLFQPVDGAVCPTADTSTAQAAAAAYSLLINKGLIRVFIPMPTADILQFSITGVVDPYHCTSSAATGLTSPTTGIVSQYPASAAVVKPAVSYKYHVGWPGAQSGIAGRRRGDDSCAERDPAEC